MNILVLILKNAETLISQVDDVSQSDLGKPDCKLTNPMRIMLYSESGSEKDYTLSPWMYSFTNDTEFLIHSDHILTMAKPKSVLAQKYLNTLASSLTEINLQEDSK